MITLVSGGQRSGKSVFAEKLALAKSENPIYMATARVWDDEIRKRVEIHRKRRGNSWTNMEIPLFVGDCKLPDNSVVLLDCLTMLASNWFFEHDEQVELALEDLKHQLSTLFSNKSDFIVVTNEIGLGGVSDNEMQRKFTDLQGSVNQFVASFADEMYLLVSGIPLKIK